MITRISQVDSLNTKPGRRSARQAARLLLGLFLATLPAAVQGQFNYTTSNGTITITRYDCRSGTAIIPGFINDLPVTAIGDSAFADCTDLTSVSIPDSVTTIGDSAFAGCAELNSITIPDGVTTIGDRVFAGCTGLTSVKIGNGVTTIRDSAFNRCTSLTSVTIPSSVTSIGVLAFESCSGLNVIEVEALNPAYSSLDGVLFDKDRTTLLLYPGGKAGSYTLPDGVTSIGSMAFLECRGLTSVTIGNSVSTIGVDAFAACTGLTSVSIGNGVSVIGGGMFYHCTSLTSVTIPNSVTTIGNRAFQSCTSLTSVTIPNSVTRIGALAFTTCTGLTSVTIPNSVTAIGNGAFYWCTGLTSVHFLGNAPASDNSVFDSSEGTTVYYLPGTLGWGSMFAGRPTAIWSLPYPVILSSGPGFGATANGFGFIISWATTAAVVVEASPNLPTPVWKPTSTNVLTAGTSPFTDPLWTEHNARLYRIVTQ